MEPHDGAGVRCRGAGDHASAAARTTHRTLTNQTQPARLVACVFVRPRSAVTSHDHAARTPQRALLTPLAFNHGFRRHAQLRHLRQSGAPRPGMPV